jgi:hypothetical protein
LQAAVNLSISRAKQKNERVTRRICPWAMQMAISSVVPMDLD